MHTEPSRTRDHVPPLLRGIGFLLVLLTSLAVGFAEHRADVHTRNRLALLKTQAEDAAARESGPQGSVAQEIRLLRLQLMQDEDLADKDFDNPWFQLLGSLGTGLVALSFLYEASAKWPRRPTPPASKP